MTDKLKLFNGALRKIGHVRLSVVDEDVKARHVLDNCYDDVIAECLEEGWWNFALRSMKMEASTSEETEFGYSKIYNKPNDWVRTYAFSADEHLKIPIIHYQDIRGYWLTDHDPVYVQFVSNGDGYGMDLGAWPQNFVKFVQLALATEICEDITGSDNKMELLSRDRLKALKLAKKLDALNDPVTKFPPPGRFVSARMGGSGREGRYEAG